MKTPVADGKLDSMQIKNKIVADRLDMSESGVSLIRNGKRFPLMSTMERIESEYGWKVTEQVAARSDYPEAFEQMLLDHYATEGLPA